MLTELAHGRHLAQLGQLKEILDEAELATNLLEKSEAIPLHVLMAAFQEDQKGRDRFLHFSFLPLNDEDITAIQLLQIYSTLPFHLGTGARAEVSSLLLEINTRLPIGHFGINEDGEIHYRYVYTLSASRSFESDETLEIITLFVYMCDMFAPYIEQVAAGELQAEQVIQALRG
ncbi:YbjN domain-containing protein [Paenibacillus roseipurpureus]|uniref:YbjN domain-containing protein n=1 Tax=Paenibacillus roseopurpureus TaxID=2918901 RepID=A0AA96RMA9_9BACL|nr:YbjN domain-containing protein [Paenibacillus sp. MBLB1832]WNR44017.1 YbjN domain-containing protein [Paenibacillus sp. MBLB1832]